MFDIECPADQLINDCLHPEWAALRFARGGAVMGGVGGEPLLERSPFVASGPTSKATLFCLPSACIFGLGLKPAGWAKFVTGPASDFTNRSVDGAEEPAFALFVPILRMVQDLGLGPDETAEAINLYLLQQLNRGTVRVELIHRVHDALRDPEIGNVVELGQRVSLGLRSLERICLRYFGFPPKLLLRRQRFLRSLARYMLDPERNWSEALDPQYYDQAQFVRDFRSFMGVTPTEYSEQSHPILNTVMAQRMADIGATPATDLPTVLRYGGQVVPEENEEPRQRGRRRLRG